MPRNQLVLAIAAVVALWATVEFAGKAWELFNAGKLFFAVMSAGIAGFAAYLLQGYLRLFAGLALGLGSSPQPGPQSGPNSGPQSGPPPGPPAVPPPARPEAASPAQHPDTSGMPDAPASPRQRSQGPPPSH